MKIVNVNYPRPFPRIEPSIKAGRSASFVQAGGSNPINDIAAILLMRSQWFDELFKPLIKNTIEEHSNVTI